MAITAGATMAFSNLMSLDLVANAKGQRIQPSYKRMGSLPTGHRLRVSSHFSSRVHSMRMIRPLAKPSASAFLRR